MTIFRTQHNSNYTVINNTICKDKRLSWKAKGIFLYAFSRKDDWEFHLNDIINQSTDGKDSVSAGLRELERMGYLVRNKIREKGKFNGIDYVFHETPQELKEFLPKAENPSAENPPLTSTDSLSERITTENVVVYASLKNLKDPCITEDQKISLSKKYSEETVNDAVLVVVHPDFVHQFNIAKSLNAACKYGWKIAEKIIPEKIKKEWCKENLSELEGMEVLFQRSCSTINFYSGETVDLYQDPKEVRKIVNEIRRRYV